MGFRIVYIMLSGLLRCIVFVRREGPRLPKGAVILAPNHNSFMDPVMVQMSSWRHVSFMMSELYYNPGSVRWFFKFFRAIPVKEGKSNRDALAAAEKALAKGWAVCIFPEGGIARDGKIKRFHPGVAALAASSGAPVVPVGIVGTFEAFPRHKKLPRLFQPITVRYGEPISAPREGADEGSRKELLRSTSQRIHDAVARLLGQESAIEAQPHNSIGLRAGTAAVETQ